MTVSSTIQPELTSLEAKLVAEIKSDKEEVRIREKRIKTNESLLNAIRESLGASKSSDKASGYGTKADILRAAIAAINVPRFNQVHVAAEIRRTHPTMDLGVHWLRTSLWTLAKKGVLIKQVEPGNNRQPAIYEKLATAPVRGTSTFRNGLNLPQGDVEVLNVGTLESFVRAKNRRMDDITTHFNVDIAAVDAVLAATSKVRWGSRGWIKYQFDEPKS